jgi:hypothetical protein
VEASSIKKGHTYTSQNKFMNFAAKYSEQASYPTLTVGGDAAEWWISLN